MLLKPFFITVIFVLMFSTQGMAKSYDHWELLYGNADAKIERIYDKELKQEVVQFESVSSRDTYINGAKQGKNAWNNSNDKILQWQFNFDESYVIIVSVTTLDGHRNIIYTSANEDGNLYYGLGEESAVGEWQTITRDLEYDLHRYEPRNSIVSVNAFLIRGSGKITKVELLNAVPGHKVQEKPKRKKTVPPTKEIKQPKNPVSISTAQKTNKFPSITLNKGELVYHRLGEPFFDPGITAKDSEGRLLEVDILGEVNINKVNKYTLTYIATDTKGNTVTRSRVVMVYKSGVSEESPESKSHAEKSVKEKQEEKPTAEAVAESEPTIIQTLEIEEENLRQEEMLEFLE